MRRLLSLSLVLVFATSLSAQQAPLAISIDVGDRLASGDLADVRYSVENTSDAPLSGVVLDMSTSYPSNITDVAASDPAANCGPVDHVTFRRIGCIVPLLAPHATATATMTVHFPPGHYNLSLFVDTAPPVHSASASRTTTFYREFRVTTPADDGAGSLRQAILDANAQCPAGTPCRIGFEIAGAPPAEGWFTIALASPLPAITAPEIVLDGARQKAITGDTNANGPEVFLDGRGVNVADGLIIKSAGAAVRGLAIGGFPGNGILALQSGAGGATPWLIEGNNLGTDPGGAPVPNGLRGLMGDPFDVEVTGNVLSHNRRSGIFLLHAANIHDNRIEANGASGIFLGATSGTSISTVADNVIDGNHDFGVALVRDGLFAVRGNSIGGNGGGGIDVGLDGRTPRSDTNIGPMAVPRITAAHFDAASGDTVIEGLVTEAAFSARERTVYVYANRSIDADGFAEGERLLGAVPVGAGGAFSLRVHDDLRGLYIDANLVVIHWDLIDLSATTEFGPPLRVGE